MSTPEFWPFSYLPHSNPITISQTKRVQLLSGTFENVEIQTVLESILSAGAKTSVCPCANLHSWKLLQSDLLWAIRTVSSFNIKMHYNDIVSSRVFDTFPLQSLSRDASTYLPPSTRSPISIENVQWLNQFKRLATEITIDRSTPRKKMLGYL